MKKILLTCSSVRRTAYCLLLISFLPSCDSASANPYMEMYERQVVVSDSLKAEIDLLGVRLNEIYNTSLNKIDSLKNVVTQKNILISQKDSIIASHNQNVNAILQSIETGLENLSTQALQNLINIQNR